MIVDLSTGDRLSLLPLSPRSFVMPENFTNGSATPVSAGAKAGAGSAKTKIFLSLMLAGTVAVAGGYAVMSKGGSSEGSQGAPFDPPVVVESETEKKPTENAESKADYKVAPVNEETSVPPIAVAAAKNEKPAPQKATSAKQDLTLPPPPPPADVPVRIAKADTSKANTSKAPAKETKPVAAPVKTKTQPRLAQAPQVQRVAGGWPEYRGPNRDGISRETGWFKDGEPKMLWKANVGAGFASIVVANGRAYAMGNNNNTDTIYCFDAATGQGIWKMSYPCDLMDKQHEGGPSATPTVDDGVVYTYSKMGQLNAWDAATGKLGWSKNIPREMGGQIPGWGITSTPAVYGNSLFVMTGAPGKCITAFDKKTGNVIWQAGKAGPSYSALQVFEWKGAPYLAVYDAEGVKFMDTKNGKVLWSYGWKTSYDVNAAIPIIDGDKVFISSGYGTGCAMLQSTADEPLLWKNRDMKNHFNASVLLNGAIFGFDESELACLDVKTGRKLWSQGRLGKGSLMAADNKLIILSERGELVIAEANPKGFKELSRTQILGGKCWSAPSLANGRIYARNANGDVVCAKF